MKQRSDRRINVIAGAVATTVVAVIAAVVAVSGSGTPQTQSRRLSQSTQSQTAPVSPAVQPSVLPFAPDSVWNQPLAADATISPHSAEYRAEFQHLISAYGVWINTYRYSVPVYIVGPSQRRVPVTLDISGPGPVGELAARFAAGVPIPAGAMPAQGTDAHMVVWQPSRNTLWEFFHARNIGGTWHARWGGEITDVSQSPGYYRSPRSWGASATSLSMLGGLMMVRELRAGTINHALAVSIPEPAAGRYVFPAQRDDGNNPASNAIPEGTRFRLSPKLDVNRLNLPPVARMMALAVQRYGMIVRDQSGSVSFSAEAPRAGQADPYEGHTGLFGGRYPSQLLASFPWKYLEVVAPPAHAA